MEKFEDVAAAIREYKDIIRTEKNSIICVAYQQGKIFRMSLEKEKFLTMVKNIALAN